MPAEERLPTTSVTPTGGWIHPRARVVGWSHAPATDRTPESYVIYEAAVSGEKWQLQLNDFPAEPLYTLLIGGRFFENFDEFPSCWLRPTDEASSETNP